MIIRPEDIFWNKLEKILICIAISTMIPNLLYYLRIGWEVTTMSSFKIPTESMEPTLIPGDNGLNSRDSRYWGPVPEPYIVGVATRIWKSVDKYTGEWRSDRFLKGIE